MPTTQKVKSTCLIYKAALSLSHSHPLASRKMAQVSNEINELDCYALLTLD